MQPLNHGKKRTSKIFDKTGVKTERSKCGRASPEKEDFQ